MNTLDKLTTNALMNEVYSETPLRAFTTMVAGGVIGTAVAAILDINTGLPAWVWASAWYVIPILIWTFFGLPARHGYGKAESGRTQRAIRTYLDMPKREKMEFPKNTLKMLQTEDWKVVEDFQLAAADLASLRHTPGTNIEDAREQMEQVRKNISITKKTYEELG